MTKRLEILTGSLAKKQALLEDSIANHFKTVGLANGQPLNDKRNGAATLKKWDKQNDAIRNLQKSIEKTERAIEREQKKIANVAALALPEPIRALIAKGVLVQWRKYPNRFFVVGVNRARIILQEGGTVAHSHVREIAGTAQYNIFRDVYNQLRKDLGA